MKLFKKEEKLQKVWQTYEWLAKKFKNIFVIDGTKNKELIHKEIFEIIENILN